MTAGNQAAPTDSLGVECPIKGLKSPSYQSQNSQLEPLAPLFYLLSKARLKAETVVKSAAFNIMRYHLHGQSVSQIGQHSLRFSAGAIAP